MLEIALLGLTIETITRALAQEVVSRSFTWVAEEVKLLSQVHSRMSHIKSEFEVIEAFLRYTNAWKDNHPVLEAWVKQIRELAFDVEDVMDTYTHMLGKEGRNPAGKALRRSRGIKRWHGMAKQMKEIRVRLSLLRDIKDRYGISLTPAVGGSYLDPGASDETSRNRAMDAHFIDDDDIIGYEKYQKKLKTLLMAHGEMQQPTVIYILGMGGLGKTTLATSIYKDSDIKKHFRLRAWIYVSRTYGGADDLLRKIIKELLGGKEKIAVEVQAENDIDSLDHKNLVGRLQKKLRGKKYMIVLDDVWSSSVWKDIHIAFGGGANGSMIVITTRNEDLAQSVSEEFKIKLEPMAEEKALDLLFRKAFHRDRSMDDSSLHRQSSWRECTSARFLLQRVESLSRRLPWGHDDNIDSGNIRQCPQHLQAVAMEIVKKCGLLPLAIVTLGSMLSLRRKEETEWKKVLDGIELHTNPELRDLTGAFALSYRDLPDYLTHCLLYCSIFPGGYPIKRKKLIRLWIAEGFIQRRGSQTLEEVAEENIQELIRRSMLQKVKKNDSGRVKSFQMHDMMRDFAVPMAEKEALCHIYEHSQKEIHGKVRRLSVHSFGKQDEIMNVDMSNIRTLILFKTVNLSLIKRFKLLRVLDFQDLPLDKLPDAVWNLFNLHYLGLRGTKISVIPSSLKRLIHLQTLDLAFTGIKKLPSGLTRLTHLRNLFVHNALKDSTSKSYNYFNGFPAPRGIWNLKNLHTLQAVEADKDLVEHLHEMVQLRTLRIIKVTTTHHAKLCEALTKMTNLRRLDIFAATELSKMLGGPKVGVGWIPLPPEKS